MSRRHRSEELDTRPGKEMRQQEHRHVRRVVHQALEEDPFESVLPVEPVVSGRRTSLGPAPVTAPKRQFRHWKLPAWKRRTNMRLDRIAAEQALIDQP